jgi:signal peptidase I
MFVCVGLVLFSAIFVRWFAGHPLTVRTDAMFPTVMRGEVVWVARKGAVAGDVVQVDLGGDYGLYRIAGTSTQVVELKGRRLRIDGARAGLGQARTVEFEASDCRVEQVPAVTARIAEHTFEFVPGGADMRASVPKGEVFLLGDHRSVAGDSRAWGALTDASVQGVASRVLWSWDSCKSAVRWLRLWKSIE